jgi:membrane protease YdiL (CAAX protease family)
MRWSEDVDASAAITQPPGERRWITRHRFVTFVLLAFGWSWLAWLLAMVIGGNQVLVIVGGFGPMLAALAVQRLTGESLRPWLRAMVRWRVAPVYYAYALGLPVLIYLVIDLLLLLFGQPVDWSLLGTRMPALMSTFLFVAVLGGGLEEPGWRGYALPRLQRSHTSLTATAILGFVWGLWHVPLYGPLGFVVPFVLAFFYTWLYNKTGSVLLCILLHASFTPAQDHLLLIPVELMPSGGQPTTINLVVLATYLTFAASLVLLTHGRLGTASGPAGPEAVAAVERAGRLTTSNRLTRKDRS